MDPARPNLGVRPCAVCGEEVDPLRAPYVVAVDARLAPLCGDDCRTRFSKGERLRPSRLVTPPKARPAPARRPRSRIGDLEFPLSPVATSVAALLTSPFAASRGMALVTTALVLLAAVDIALRSRNLSAHKAPLPLAAIGISFVAVGAYRDLSEAGPWGMTGAAIAALAVATRYTLWVARQEPLEREAEALEETLAETLTEEHAGAQAAAIRGERPEQRAFATKAATISVRVGVALVLAVGGLVAFFPPAGAGSALGVIGAVFASLPLLAPMATTARAHLHLGLRAAARGIYFDGPRAIERFGLVSHAILPAHGTVTLPRAELVTVRRLEGEELDEEALLALVTSAEAAAGTHPIAAACRAECRKRGIDVPLARRARAQEGRGVTSLSASGEEVVVGNRALLLSEGVSVARADREASAIEASGDTVVFVAIRGRVRGVLGFRYSIREGIAETVERLHDLDVDTTLLSGDHHATAEALAQSLGIPHVRAELLPAEKLTELARIQENAEPVVVIEHADAQASLLPAARLSVRLEGAGRVRGTGAATLVDDPKLASEAIALARRLRRSMIASGTVIAICGLPTLTLAALFDLPPAVAALVPLCVEAFAHPTGARAT